MGHGKPHSCQVKSSGKLDMSIEWIFHFNLLGHLFNVTSKMKLHAFSLVGIDCRTLDRKDALHASCEVPAS